MLVFLSEIFLFGVLLPLPRASCVFHLDDERSSFISLKQDACLQGHIIQTNKAPSFSRCAHYCLANAKCKSVNYKKKGVCELNDVSPQDRDMQGHVVMKCEAMLGWWINYVSKTYTFTSLNGQGRNGPTTIDGYNQTSLQGAVHIVNGIQYWETPESGNYIIETIGASGSNGTCSKIGCKGWSYGGKGAKMKGSFPLKKGTQLKIIVGQQGTLSLDTKESPGGGGGGTFVTLADNTPLIVAGGGGGGGITSNGTLDGDPGQSLTNGSRYGGLDGNGGLRYDSLNNALSPMVIRASHFGGAGAGFLKSGDSMGGSAAKSFITGGTGGQGNSEGGFGGGGFSASKAPGGGGGYSGGGVILNDNTGGSAGGGGSFNSGSEQIKESGVNRGDGRVTIIISK